MVKRYFRLVDNDKYNSRVLYSKLGDIESIDLGLYWYNHIVIENWVLVLDTILDGGDVIVVDTIRNNSSELLYKYTDNLIKQIKEIYANRQKFKEDTGKFDKER